MILGRKGSLAHLLCLKENKKGFYCVFVLILEVLGCGGFVVVVVGGWWRVCGGGGGCRLCMMVVRG